MIGGRIRGGWIPPTKIGGGTSSASLSQLALGFFGTGSDGACNFDGVATVAGHAQLGAYDRLGSLGSITLYALTRDIYATDMTVAAGVFVYTGGFRVFVKGTLTLTGYIGAPGVNGVIGTLNLGGAGGDTLAPGTLGGRNAGGAGAAPAGGPSPGIATAAAPTEFSTTGGTGGAGPTTDGVAGGAGRGGGGGGGGGTALPAAGGASGTVTAVIAARGSINNIWQAITGCGAGLGSATQITGGSGGGGGKGGSTTSAGGGGGGGSGGMPSVLCAREITGAGIFTVAGGNGGNAYQGAIASTQSNGGGGGGGGGWGAIVLGTGAFPTIIATGGLGGAKNPTGGTGGNGGAGGVGEVKLFKLGV